MSTGTKHRAHPVIDEHLKAGEFHKAIEAINKVPLVQRVDAANVILERLAFHKDKADWREWRDIQLVALVTTLITLGELQTAVEVHDQISELGDKKGLAEKLLEEALAKRVASARGTYLVDDESVNGK